MPLSFARGVALTASDWRLVAGASVAQIAAACALRWLPLPTVRSLGARLRPLAHVLLKGSDERVLWAIEATGRRLPRVSTCLVRAMVADVRLSSLRRPLQLRIGVSRVPTGDLRSHAWLMDRERLLLGGPVAPEFQLFVAWESLP